MILVRLFLDCLNPVVILPPSRYFDIKMCAFEGLQKLRNEVPYTTHALINRKKRESQREEKIFEKVLILCLINEF